MKMELNVKNHVPRGTIFKGHPKVHKAGIPINQYFIVVDMFTCITKVNYYNIIDPNLKLCSYF